MQHAEHFIGNRANGGRHFFGRQFRPAVNDHVIPHSHVRDIRNIQHDLVHADAAHNGSPFAPDHHAAFIGQMSTDAVRIPYGNRSDAAFSFRGKSPAVADIPPGRQCFHKGHLGL